MQQGLAIRTFSRRSRAFTLIEIVIASVILAIAFLASISLINFQRIQMRKAVDETIMLDFAQHYLELARALPYDRILVATPVNALFDGTSGAPNIRIPPAGTWVDMTTDDYKAFQPELTQFTSREPQYQIEITEQAPSRAKLIDFHARWRPPLKRGAEWVTLNLKVVVYSK